MAHPHVLTDNNAEKCENDAAVRVIKPSGLEQFLCDRHLAREMPIHKEGGMRLVDHFHCAFCGSPAGMECKTPRGLKLEPNQYGIRCHTMRMRAFGRRGRPL